MGAAFGRRMKANAALFWRWFQYWRRRYMWLRLAIIVLIFAEPVYGVFHPLIRELVVIAIKGIESAKAGPRRYVDYYQFEDKKRLQKHLLTHFDANRDGRLERGEAARLRKETGLAPRQVTGSGLRAELDPLLEANRKLKLVPAEVTSRELRREALKRALADVEREHDELWREMKPDLDMPYPGWRDYLTWATWKRGLDSFRSGLSYAEGMNLGQYFLGIEPTEFWRPLARQGMIGWLVLLAIVASCVCRYGKGEALKKRFEEDPGFALAPCPVCNLPTHDYGALMNHRGARAWAVVFMMSVGFWIPNALFRAASESGYLFHIGFLTTPAQRPEWMLPLIVVLGVARWLLWPREVHAAHRWPSVILIGLGGKVALVAFLLGTTVLFTLAQSGELRRVVTVLGGKPRAMQGPRRVPEEKRLAAMAAASARPVPPQSSRRGMRGGQGLPQREVRGSRRGGPGGRVRGRGRAQRGRRGERGTRRGM